MKKQYRDFLFYCLFVSFFFCCFHANLLKSLCFCSIKDTLKMYFCHCGDTFLTLLKKRLVMHACARSAEQNYGSIYIYRYISGWKRFWKRVYIYIYKDESLLFCNCTCSLEYSSLSTLAGLSYHICGKLEVAFKASPSSQHQHCTVRPRRPIQYCLQLYLYIYIYIYRYIYIYTSWTWIE